MTNDLTVLGWTADRERDVAAVGGEALQIGRVCLEHNHVYRVRGAGAEWLAEAAGRLKHEAAGRHELPAVGDWVLLKPVPSGDRAQITRILPRRSWFSRKVAGRETREQVVAANIDVVLVVFGLDNPVNSNSIERYLVVARQSQVKAAIVLNKVDLRPDVTGAISEAQTAAGDAPVYAVSTKSGVGLNALEALLAPGVTMALLGPSGAGKSSIVNALVGREALPTGEVREWDARGRHTSVHRHLIVREAGGLIIDTPGMRELQLWESAAPVGDAFDDLTVFAGDCRFRDCRHDKEPGCGVKAATERGALPLGRYDSYIKLMHEQEALERRMDERALLEEKRNAKVQGKALKSMQKDRGR